MMRYVQKIKQNITWNNEKYMSAVVAWDSFQNITLGHRYRWQGDNKTNQSVSQDGSQ